MPKQTPRRSPKWAAVAEMLLQESDKPLHSHEIVQLALQRKLVTSKGKTPHHTVQATIWRNMQRLGDESPFVVVGKGRNSKKYWLKSKLKKGQKVEGDF